MRGKHVTLLRGGRIILAVLVILASASLAVAETPGQTLLHSAEKLYWGALFKDAQSLAENASATLREEVDAGRSVRTSLARAYYLQGVIAFAYAADAPQVERCFLNAVIADPNYLPSDLLQSPQFSKYRTKAVQTLADPARVTQLVQARIDANEFCEASSLALTAKDQFQTHPELATLYERAAQRCAPKSGGLAILPIGFRGLAAAPPFTQEQLQEEVSALCRKKVRSIGDKEIQADMKAANARIHDLVVSKTEIKFGTFNAHTQQVALGKLAQKYAKLMAGFFDAFRVKYILVVLVKDDGDSNQGLGTPHADIDIEMNLYAADAPGDPLEYQFKKGIHNRHYILKRVQELLTPICNRINDAP